MAAAMAYCTSNTSFHQHSLSKSRTQFTPVSRRTTSSPSKSFSSPIAKPHIEEKCIIKTIKSDDNNNNNSHHIHDTTTASNDEVLYITSDDDDDDAFDVDSNEPEANDIIDEEQYLSLVGLRRKTKPPTVAHLTIRPLTKRLACPVCLLPLPKYSERVRQALYIRLPSLKFFSIIRDIEAFCSTDENAKAHSLLPRSMAHARNSSAMKRNQRGTRLSKTELINMTSKTTRNHASRISSSKHVRSVLQCYVVLDRLEQSTIDRIIQNSADDDDVDNKTILTLSTPDQSLCPNPKASRSSSIATNRTTTTTTRTTITTMTTEKTIVKRKSTATDVEKCKRIKVIDDDRTSLSSDDTKSNSSSSEYKRIYLKCFVCSKRQYVDAEATNSDVLHSHWLEHDRELSLNIYDSEIDSILTRVVEFFNLPKQHTLEGRIKTVFILNSKEVRSPSTIDSQSSDSCIVID